MQKPLTLMNRTVPVLTLIYNYDTHQVVRIGEILSPKHMPPGILDPSGKPNKRTLTDWWENRAIPASRKHIDAILRETHADHVLSLIERSYGLSLSDQYWMDDPEHPRKWEDINFFTNPFSDDLGQMTLRQSHVANPNLYSPNSTLNGDLPKKWTIQDGKRVLLKSGSGFVKQEVYNEAIATALHRRLLEPDEYVAYWLARTDGGTYSACADIVSDHEELVPMYDFMRSRKHLTDQNDWQFIRDICKETGIRNTEATLTKMFTCDAILANHDRHYRNFGLVRDVHTLQYTRMIPIFDTGNSLWCDKESLHTPGDYDYIAKPFGRNGMPPAKQLALFTDYSWFDETGLNGFIEEAVAILEQNENMPPNRIDAIARGLSRTIGLVTEHARRCRSAQQKAIAMDAADMENRLRKASDLTKMSYTG